MNSRSVHIVYPQDFNPNNYSKNDVPVPSEKETPLKYRSSDFRENVSEYFSSTSLHGFKYISDEGRPVIEKVLWSIFCLLAIAGTIYFIYPVFYKYNNTPAVTYIESTTVPIWEVDFPAVTICNVNKAIRAHVDRENDRPPWATYSLGAMLNLVDLLARTGTSFDFPTYGKNEDKVLQEILAKHSNESGLLMRKIKQTQSEMLLKCWWLGKVTPCTRLFKTRITEHGYCFSFNSLNIQDAMKPLTDDEHSQSESSGTSATPKKAKKINSAGSRMGITVLLDPQLKEYFATADSFYGFKVLIHSSDDFAYVSQRSFVVAPGKEVFAAVTPEKIKSTKELQNVKIEHRKCRFDTEDVLASFSAYTYENCLMECKIRTMKETCGCVSYIYSITNNNSDICNYDQLKCLSKNYRKFLSLRQIDTDPNDNSDFGEGMACDCLSSCDDVAYHVEVTSSKFPLDIEEIFPDLKGKANVSDLILLRAYFKNLSFLQFKRDIIYTWTDLIASFGSVVGLFLGFSLVSALEILYFFTLRPCLQYTKKRKLIKEAEKQEQLKIFSHEANFIPYNARKSHQQKMFQDAFAQSNIRTRNSLHPGYME